MNSQTQRKRTLLQRFCARGGLNVLFTTFAVWLTFPTIHRWCGYDWFYSVLLCFIASVMLAHIVFMPLVFIPFAIYLARFHRSECPVCHERALVVGIAMSEPTADPELYRQYQVGRCERCKRTFRLLGNGTFQEQPGTE